jgi:hypothetical protein
MSLSKNQKKRSNKKKRVRALLSNDSASTRVMTWSGGDNNRMVMSSATDTGLRRLRITPRTGLSDQGISFLKCAFAPPDFQQGSLGGVPDSFRGQSLVRKHRYVSPTTVASGSDTYFLLCPIPGVAYLQATVASGTQILNTTQFTAVNYTDFSSMFGSASINNADIVTKFRFVSNHFEIIPTVNQMTWSGSIQAWKLPIQLVVRQGGTSTVDIFSIEGLQGANTSLSNQYSGPFIMGLYTACYNSNPDFDFRQIQESLNSVPTYVEPNDFGQFVSSGTNMGIPGFDNGFESLIVKISGVSSTESLILKTWACVEYQVSPSNSIFEFTTMSPCDPVALDLYKQIISELPVGVPFTDNESFWNRVLMIINRISGVGAMIPGTVGAISRGTNLISGALLPFTM